MIRLSLCLFLAIAASTQGQYSVQDDAETPELISAFARSQSRLPRGGGYGGDAEILPVAMVYDQKPINNLPNYGGGGGGFGPGGGDIKPGSGGFGGEQLKPGAGGYGAEQFQTRPGELKPGGGGFGGQIQPGFGGQPGYGGEQLKQPGYGGEQLKPPGYGGEQLKPVAGGYGAQPLQGGHGYGGSPVKKPSGYGGAENIKPIGPISNHGGGGWGSPYQHRQPSSLGYGSGSGISFGNPGGVPHNMHGNPQGFGHGFGYGQQKPVEKYEKLPINQGYSQQMNYPVEKPINQGYGGGPIVQPAVIDSYSKPPVIADGYGTPLAPPLQSAPSGYGR